VDRRSGIVRLEVGATKNGEARPVYLDEEMKRVIEDRWESRKGQPTMIGLVEGLMPSGKGNLEQERRICFVAISRAMRHLFLSYPLNYLGHPRNPYSSMKSLENANPTPTNPPLKPSQEDHRDGSGTIHIR
jgi:hypothetical protein